MSLTKSNDSGTIDVSGPLHITGFLQILADLQRENNLADPLSLRMTKSHKATCEIGLTSFAEMARWADTFEVDDYSRRSSTYEDGSVIHSAWLADWCGWHVRFTVHEEPPPARSHEELVAETVAALLES